MRFFLFLLILIYKSLFFAQINLTNSLVACYGLDGNGSEPVNALTGTLSMATSTVDRFNSPGSALSFNGNTSCFIRLPDNPLLKPINEISFSLWIKPNSNSCAQIVYTRNNLTSNFEAYQFGIYANFPVFRLNKSSSLGNDIVLSTTTVTPGTWYHIVCTIDNNYLKLYINGTLEGSTPASFPGFDYMQGKEVFIGASNESFSCPFIGSIDNLRFYDRSLTVSEASSLYNQDPSCSSFAFPPQASFSVSSILICAGKTMTLTDLSSNNPSSWNWQIPGSTIGSASVASPTVIFSNPGNYSISLVTSNNFGASNTATQSISVVPNPTINMLSGNPTICAGGVATIAVSGASSYSWSNGQTGSLIAVMPALTTTYTVVGTDLGGCTNSSNCVVTIKDCGEVGIIENELNNNCYVFPNPTNGKLVLNIPDDVHSAFITNQVGEVVLNISTKYKQETTINLEGLPNGIYLLTLKGSTGNLKTFRIVKE